MRRTYVKNGIKERVNYLIGTNDQDPANPTEAGLTVWSAQASMIENTRRIIKAVVGSATTTGRVMSGLKITQDGSNMAIKISAGIGFTPAGNSIVLQKEVTKSLGTPAEGTEIPIYLMYEERASDLEDHDSEIQGTTSTPQNIVWDDKISGTDVDATIIENIEITTQSLSVDDGVYIGKVVITGVSPDTFDIIHSVYTKDQTVGPDQVDFSHTGGFAMAGVIPTGSPTLPYSTDTILRYDGVDDGTKVHVIGSDNRLRYVRVFRDVKADDGGRPAYDTDNPVESFVTSLQVWGWQADGAGVIQLTDGVDLSDPLNDNSVDLIEYADIIIPDNVYALTIKTVTVGPTGSTNPDWDEWYPDTYGPARIDFVIERLIAE